MRVRQNCVDAAARSVNDAVMASDCPHQCAMAARSPRIGGHGGEIFVLDRRGIELSPLPSADTGTLWRQACLMSQGLSDDYILRGRQLGVLVEPLSLCNAPMQGVVASLPRCRFPLESFHSWPTCAHVFVHSG